MEFLYPQGKNKALTLSYDDGQIYDRKLIEILNSAGLKATFHLNSGNLDREGYIAPQELPQLYKGHEIACHGVTHRHPLQMTREQWLTEVWQDRLALEKLSGSIVHGMSYAFGEYSAGHIAALRAMGITYSRTVESTGSFALPCELLRWQPTCHHNDRLLEHAQKFLRVPGYEKMPLFYVWGHSYEFEREQTWALIEEFVGVIGGKQDVWYATNGEVADYLQAIRGLRQSADGRLLQNTSAQAIWLLDNGQVRCAEPGQCIHLGQ